MSTYVVSDIHGMYDKFIKLLDEIKLQEDDTLYVLGDMVDRGPNPMKVVQKIMGMENVKALVGNHERGAIGGLKFLAENEGENGMSATEKDFLRLSADEKNEVLDFLQTLMLYDEIEINGQDYILVHGGFGNFKPDRPLSNYSVDELVWTRPDFETPYYQDKIVVCGHTPTQLIEGNDRPGYIMKKNNYIAIDCGACFKRGRLAAICLDTGMEYYV